MITLGGDLLDLFMGEVAEGSTVLVGKAATGRGDDDPVIVSGELDIVTTAEVATKLIREVDRVGPEITVDLTGVTFCDASGLSALVKAANHAERFGGALIVEGASPTLARVLRVTGLDERFSPGSADARRAASARGAPAVTWGSSPVPRPCPDRDDLSSDSSPA